VDLERAVEAIRRLNVSSVAVALLHAYANPEHELIIGKRLSSVVPYVSLSHQVNPEEREYERTSATALNAAVMPVIGEYLDKLDREVPKSANFHFFHSAGGMASAAAMRDRPLALALSGPAAGAAAAQRVTRDLALDNALTLDMGGTTTDVCLIRNGKPEIQREAILADQPIRQPMVAVKSIGAGGGSLAYVEAGMLRVGPRSAGASPGPACYGLGGTAPTVTDANLLLGYLDATRPLADGVRLDARLAEAAIGRLAGELGLGPIETALGILRIANANMLQAIRNITVDRGIDGRRCTLVAFGGAGPLHAAALAREFGIRQVVVPAYSSAYSALGCAVADLSYTQQCTVRMSSSVWSADRLARLRDNLLTGMMPHGGATDVAIEDTALIRYVGQSYSVEVPYRFPAAVDTLGHDFRTLHQQLYAFATDEDWQVEAIRVTASVAERPFALRPTSHDHRSTLAPRSTQPCWFGADGAVATPRYCRDEIAPGTRIAGPAILEDEWSTVTVPPEMALEAAVGGHLVLTREATR
jgi:N-methylhydantoinase A